MASEFFKSLSLKPLKKLNNFAGISTVISETALLSVLGSDLTKFVCNAAGSGQVTWIGFGDGIAKWEISTYKKLMKIQTPLCAYALNK